MVSSWNGATLQDRCKAPNPSRFLILYLEIRLSSAEVRTLHQFSSQKTEGLLLGILHRLCFR